MIDDYPFRIILFQKLHLFSIFFLTKFHHFYLIIKIKCQSRIYIMSHYLRMHHFSFVQLLNLLTYVFISYYVPNLIRLYIVVLQFEDIEKIHWLKKEREKKGNYNILNFLLCTEFEEGSITRVLILHFC